MISTDVKKQYTTTIGIECHVQLKTVSKLFSAASNDAREAPANTLVNHIDFGLPGALPVLNIEAVHLAAKAAFALNSRPQPFSKFDRKHYFYPDLPMGYQITQFDQPIVLGGEVDIEVDGVSRTIGITRAHLEADAGKSTHPANKDYSLVDLNRAGTPLLEIVSEPDMHTAAEAKAYARELYLRMKYADVSYANLYYGNMRFDVNVSVSKTDTLGTRTETKNLNSFKAVEKTVEYEVNRQIELLEKGESIVQETRGWDDSKQKTISQRTKENADDYRYFPDPDIPPITLTDEYIAKVEAEMPVMPAEWRRRLTNSGIDLQQTETLLDNKELLDILAEAFDQKIDRTHVKNIANWLTGHLLKLISEGYDFSNKYQLNIDDWIIFSEMVTTGDLSSSRAKDLIDTFLFHVDMFNLKASLEEKRASHKKVAAEKGLIQESDESAINEVVTTVLTDNAKAAEDVKNGEMKAIGFLVGQVMKLSGGKANPGLAAELIKKQLGL
jgi:aspartyl-tRNA(Asn)/glutamyl-tRNA(Gln) amidotransferase subunit B